MSAYNDNEQWAPELATDENEYGSGEQSEIPIPEDEDMACSGAMETPETEFERPPELKNQYAFGLTLDPETGLPRITAMGRGLIAQRMVKKAMEAGKDVQQDSDIVNRMFKPVDDRAIPPQTYQVIAEILTFIYQINEAYIRENIAEQLDQEAEEASDKIVEGETEAGEDGTEDATVTEETEAGITTGGDRDEEEEEFSGVRPEERKSLRAYLEEQGDI